MATKSIFTCIILLILLCFVVMKEHASSGCKTVHGCVGANAAGFKDAGSRKVLAALRAKKAALFPGYGGSSTKKYVENSATSELRKVPSGPDPLHHNSGGPNKPKSP